MHYGIKFLAQSPLKLYRFCDADWARYPDTRRSTTGSSVDCNYLVWISYSGLGNRILTLASAFLYAVLTNRVLLIDPGVNMPDLFCEPFPEVSWLLPPDFPIIDQFSTFNQRSHHCYGCMDQIFACMTKENLPPQINLGEPILNPSGKQKTIAILFTSLSPGYFEEFQNMYWKHPIVTGEIVGLYQTSQEEHRQTEKLWHDRKTLAEMYLLSLTDKLVTSAWSTFGYVAHFLEGLKPWILYKPEKRISHNPPCVRAVSLEPCFHAPPYYDCKKRRGTDTSKIVPLVRHCKDVSWGLKLFDQNSES
ncbi:Galactoside 2-alpha-L-fucosyltransferase [Capsicum annuum]|nr:Galactoside 2-alpha-L-fucosyltransferase [Capsicum annuum]